jgi:transcriptional regulator with PAS, ATPase and Fis domain
LRKGLAISLEIAPESALVSQSKRRLADACIGMNRYDDARMNADGALKVAEKINERVEIAACHRIYAHLECHEGNAGAARAWFRKATDMFAMIGSRYELAVTRYLAATSGYYRNGERQALLYLAREYFESENVAPYVERIDRETERLSRRSATRSDPFNDGAPTIIYADKSMKRLVELSKNVAPSNMAVLLTGATGTGKDLFARFIHHCSGRSGRFVSVNAAAIPDNMIESELFGYRKGAYTGASESTPGWIEEADGGTFYLNEIADASSELQAKLLDVIETRTICRLGERRERTIDCRIIAASNHDLEQLITEGRFRLDLYHRLNEIPISLPDLTDRGDDIRCLVEYFLSVNGVTINGHPDKEQFNRLVDIYSRRRWPGNVRQLEIEVRRLSLLSKCDLSRMVESASRYNPSEREELLTLLTQTGWNRREVARILGVNEATIRRRIKKHSLTSPQSE